MPLISIFHVTGFSHTQGTQNNSVVLKLLKISGWLRIIQEIFNFIFKLRLTHSFVFLYQKFIIVLGFFTVSEQFFFLILIRFSWTILIFCYFIKNFVVDPNFKKVKTLKQTWMTQDSTIFLAQRVATLILYN